MPASTFPYAIEFRLQIAAMTLAEELNFTRAAERLHITQPALSKQISDLETRVGFLVFKRNQKKVVLTEAGQIFIRGCRDSNAVLERAIRLARATQDEIQPVITIGHSPYVEPALVSALLSVHLPLYPHLRLRIESMFALDLSHGVMSAELDLAIITEPTDNPQLTLVRIQQSALCAVMPAEHSAAAKRLVSMEDFGGVGWMVFPRKAHPIVYDRILDAARNANVSPVELHHYVSPQQSIQLIKENFGVAFVAPGTVELFRDANLTVRPFSTPSLQVSTYLVLRANQPSRLINEFGRALLRKLLPYPNLTNQSEQLALGL